MSQHDLVLANASGAAFRSDANDGLQALGTRQSGSSAPGTTYAHMLWVDTTNGVVKRRNAANSGWLVVETIDETLVLARSSNTILGLSDKGKLVKATSTFTQTLTAAATLGDGWFVHFRNDGTGIITIDPNSTETIDGQTTLVLGPGASCVIWCDGSNFKTVGLGAWTRIGRATASSSTSVDFASGIDASADLYALHYHDVVPGTDNVDLYVRVSQDSGGTWKAGASDYRFGRYGWTDGAVGANAGSTGSTAIIAQYALGSSTGEAASGVIYLARPSTSSGYKTITAFGGLYGQTPNINGNIIAGALVLNESAINGLRVLTSSGNIARGEFELLALRKG